MLSLSSKLILRNKLIFTSNTIIKQSCNYSKKITSNVENDSFSNSIDVKNKFNTTIGGSGIMGLDEDKFDEGFKERERNKKVEKSKRVFNIKKKKKVTALEIFLNETQNEEPQIDLVDGDEVHAFPPLPRQGNTTANKLQQQRLNNSILHPEEDENYLEEEDDEDQDDEEDYDENGVLRTARGEEFDAEKYNFDEDYRKEYDNFEREYDVSEDDDEDYDQDEEHEEDDQMSIEAMQLLERRERDAMKLKKLQREKELRKKQYLLEAGFSDELEISKLLKPTYTNNDLDKEEQKQLEQQQQPSSSKKKNDRRSNYIKYQIFSKNQVDVSNLSVRLFEVDRLRGSRTHFNDDVLEEREVQVVDADGSRLGAMTGPKAYRLAYVKKLDIFLSYSGKNMVYGRLMTFENYLKITEKKVEQEVEKKENVATKPTKSVLISSNISANDRVTKFGMIKKFLQKRHSVEVTITFKNGVNEEERDEIFRLLEPEIHGYGKLQSNYEKLGGKIFSRFYQPLTVRERDSHLKKLEREENDKQLKLKERLEREEVDRLEELGEEVDPVALASKVAATIKKMQIQEQLAQENIHQDIFNEIDEEYQEKERKRKEKEERFKLEPEDGEGLTNKQIKQNKNKNKKLQKQLNYKNKKNKQQQDDDDEELF